jgi:hypothetical protein
MCYIFHYTPEQALNMPAVQFFTLLEKGKEMVERERNEFYFKMVDIAWLPSTHFEHYEVVRNFYKDQLFPPKKPVTVNGDQLMDIFRTTIHGR